MNAIYKNKKMKAVIIGTCIVILLVLVAVTVHFATNRTSNAPNDVIDNLEGSGEDEEYPDDSEEEYFVTDEKKNIYEDDNDNDAEDNTGSGNGSSENSAEADTIENEVDEDEFVTDPGSEDENKWTAYY